MSIFQPQPCLCCSYPYWSYSYGCPFLTSETSQKRFVHIASQLRRNSSHFAHTTTYSNWADWWAARAHDDVTLAHFLAASFASLAQRSPSKARHTSCRWRNLESLVILASSNDLNPHRSSSCWQSSLESPGSTADQNLSFLQGLAYWLLKHAVLGQFWLL